MRLISQLSIAALVSVASSTAIALTKRASSLDVKLSAEGNTMIKAAITNTGSRALNLLNKGTLLDNAAVEKVRVSSTAGKVPFLGIRKRVKTTELSQDAFTSIEAGQTIEVKVDMATVHDLSTGGSFKVAAYGAVPFAEAGSTALVPGQALTYNSNELEVNVDGAAAAKVERAIPPLESLDKRTVVQSDCTGSQRQNVLSALQYCNQLANAASSAATSGSASKFQEYFKTTSSSTRRTVAARLSAVAQECSSSTSGATTQYCSDVYNACDSNTLAYTQPSNDVVVNCPLYFSYLPVISQSCHAQDMATTTLHEYTHAPGVYSPGTEDNAYGYDASIQLSSSQAVLNADTYALYANAIYVGCQSC